MPITLSTLKSVKSRKKRRRGRGNSSGRGSYSGRGIKGQKSRSGGKSAGGHAGKKSPAFIRQLSKQRGFTSFKRRLAIVNLGTITETFNEGEQVTPIKLFTKGLISRPTQKVKILGQGKLTKKFSVTAHAFSKSAKDAINKIGGTVEIIKPKKSE